MSLLHIEFSAVIDASPAEVYDILSDYRIGHPAILPKPYFTKLVVEQGGKGAGTMVEVHMDVYGTKRVLHLLISEPEPGRVLVETDPEAGVITTFTVEPFEQGNRSQVTIATDSRANPGIQGLLERLVNPMITRQIYKRELEQLGDYLRRGS